MSYIGHSFGGEGNSSAEKQLVYYVAPTDWVAYNWGQIIKVI